MFKISATSLTLLYASHSPVVYVFVCACLLVGLFVDLFVCNCLYLLVVVGILLYVVGCIVVSCTAVWICLVFVGG